MQTHRHSDNQTGDNARQIHKRHTDKQALDIQTKDMHKNRQKTCRQVEIQKNGHAEKKA